MKKRSGLTLGGLLLAAVASAFGACKSKPVEDGSALMGGGGWVLPFSSKHTITQNFGRAANSGRHLGLDLVTSDKNVFAAGPGTVKYAAFSNGNGNHIVIQHAGKGGGTVYTSYSHLSQMLVKAGAAVNAGQKIGIMGSTGNSTGLHLHFAVYDKYLSDPYGYTRNRAWIGAITGDGIVYNGTKFFDPIMYINKGGASTSNPVPQGDGNAQVVGDDLFVRDAEGNQISGRLVANGDHIKVLKLNSEKQLLYVRYPTSNGKQEGWVSNATAIVQYYHANQYQNGSTAEPILDESGATIGSLNPQETATPLFRGANGMLYVIYSTSKGSNTKAGYVKYDGGFKGF